MSHNVCYANKTTLMAVPLGFNRSDLAIGHEDVISNLHQGRVTYWHYHGLYWWSLKVGSYPTFNSVGFVSSDNMRASAAHELDALGFVRRQSFVGRGA